MHSGKIMIFTGSGHGKTPAALGTALLRAAKGERVVVIQFLKDRGLADTSFCKRLDPEIKIFRFEKLPGFYNDMNSGEQEEEKRNIRNGLMFAKKVLTTGECDLLILDEVFGIIDNGIITEQELLGILSQRGLTDVILTGAQTKSGICCFADEVSQISTAHYEAGGTS